MLEDFLESKCNEIDKEAEQEKSYAAFLVDLMKQNFELYSVVFNTKKKNRMYNDLREAIFDLDTNILNADSNYYFMSDDGILNTTFLKLGWACFNSLIDEVVSAIKPYAMSPTRAGLDIVNNIRKIYGESSIEEELKIIRNSRDNQL